MTQRYKATIAYDGTGYAGWQIQPGDPTIQGELEQALATITRDTPRVHGSGRTDAGVHARGQVAHFDLTHPPHTEKLQTGLNALLPPAIRVIDLTPCPSSFHARKSAFGKEYRYHIWNAAVVPPFLVRYRTAVLRPLEVEAMNEAAALLVGRHDFAAFSANPKREVDGTVRTVKHLELKRRGSDLTLKACGDGFLYKMVRSLAGFLIRVGQGDLPPSSALDILESLQRTAIVPTAEPQGLFLWKVQYPSPRPRFAGRAEVPQG